MSGLRSRCARTFKRLAGICPRVRAQPWFDLHRHRYEELVSEKRPARYIALIECAVWAASCSYARNVADHAAGLVASRLPSARIRVVRYWHLCERRGRIRVCRASVVVHESTRPNPNRSSRTSEQKSCVASTLAIALMRWLQATWARRARQNATKTDPRWRQQETLLCRRTPSPAAPGSSPKVLPRTPP